MEEPKMTINIEEINNMINVFDNNIKQDKNGICKYYKENETITESPVWYFIEDVDIKELEKYRYVGKAVIGEFIKLRGF
jgi:hypothetical protein